MKLLIFVRSFCASMLFLLVTFLACISILFFVFILRNKKWADKVVPVWGIINLWLFNIHVTVSGEENIPNEGCLFLFNHSSHFDIIILSGIMKKTAHFGAKIELYSIPIFGSALRALGSLPIMRAERDRVLKLYDDSINRVHNGESFYLAAEGTRQPTPGIGAKFKQGPFIFAINGQFAIVPVVIRGAAECLPKHKLIACRTFWRHRVKVHIMPAIPTRGLRTVDRPKLIAEIQNLMTAMYKTL